MSWSLALEAVSRLLSAIRKGVNSPKLTKNKMKTKTATREASDMLSKELPKIKSSNVIMVLEEMLVQRQYRDNLNIRNNLIALAQVWRATYNPPT